MTDRDHTILLVEDDVDILETVKDVLSREGYNVVDAVDGKQGLDRLHEIAPPCLILLDLMMPVMSGGEFLATLRHTDTLATLPVVIMSAWSKEAAQLPEEVQGFLKKPVSLRALLEVAGKFCHREVAS